MEAIHVKPAVYHEANPIALAPEFCRALQQSQFPLIVLFMGYSRAGKSTRLNQILTKGNSPPLPGPFVARAGADAVTVGFQVCGPIPFDKLNDLHGLGLTIDRNRNPDVFLVDCEGIDHLDGSSPGFGKSMFALAQIAAVNVIVFPALMSVRDIPPLTNLFQMSRIIQAADRQLETGFVIIERDADPISETGGTLADGTNEFEEARHKQDIKRQKTACQFLQQGHVRFADANVIVLDQPGRENQVSYWNSLRDMMRFWHSIASKTLILPGMTLVGLFQKTITEIQKCPNCNNLDIGFGKLLTELVRDKLVTAQRLTIVQFPDFIDVPISRIAPGQLEHFQPWNFIAGVQTRMIAIFKAKANELHPFVCESFRTISDEFCDELRRAIASSVNAVHLRHCARTVLIDETTRLIAESDDEIRRVADFLGQDVRRVEIYPFAKWGGELVDTTQAQLCASMVKYNPGVTDLPEYREEIHTLRERVKRRVADLEFMMRRAWNGMTAARAQRDREQATRELNDAIARFERERQLNELNRHQELHRRLSEIGEAGKREQDQIRAFFTSQIESMQRVAEQHKREWEARLKDAENRHG